MENETKFDRHDTLNEIPNYLSGSFTNPVSHEAQHDVVGNYLMEFYHYMLYFSLYEPVWILGYRMGSRILMLGMRCYVIRRRQ